MTALDPSHATEAATFASPPLVHAAMAPDVFALQFDARRRERLARLARVPDPLLLDPAVVGRAAADTEVLITSWGAPRLDAEVLEAMPNLRAVLHAAGSVHGLVSDELWERGITVTSAADANAIPVAEYTFAAIIMAGKRAFAHAGQHGQAPWGRLVVEPTYGNVGRRIGIVGFSRTGRRVVRMLQQLEDVEVFVADPVVDPAAVAAAGASLVPLEAMLPCVDVLSLHAPSLPSTRGMIGARELASMQDGATLINTARGALVDHAALLFECRAGRLDAVLDVTDPEPLPATSELHRLPNVTITPHIAGSMGTEVRRLADSVLDDLEALRAGRVSGHEVARTQMGVSA